jgi:NitT/TauT family transport system substrate-binding protein
MTGERMYGRMAVKYTEIGLAKSPAPWRNVSDPSVVQELMKDQDLVNDSKQVAVKPEAFQPATQEIKNEQAQSSKIVKLEFPLNSAALTEDDKVTIDREIKELIQGFEKAYVRVEGNTDNTGQVKTNERLSLDRANSVVDYLVIEHHLDRNKFILIGNGSRKPVAGCEQNQDEECRARNRRTEFQFIWKKPDTSKS